MRKLPFILAIIVMVSLSRPGASMSQVEPEDRPEPQVTGEAQRRQALRPVVDVEVAETGLKAYSGFWDGGLGFDLVDYPGTIIARLPLPEGNYVIFAKLDIGIWVDANGEAGCRLIAGANTDEARVAWADPPSNEQLPSFTPHAIALNVVTTFSSANAVLLQCFGRPRALVKPETSIQSVQLRNIKITALQVSELRNAPLDTVE